jgi:hypothetical protein
MGDVPTAAFSDRERTCPFEVFLATKAGPVPSAASDFFVGGEADIISLRSGKLF